MGTSKMKVLALLLVATIVSARDFSKIKPGWMRNPTLVKMHEAMHGDVKSGIVGGDEAVPHSHPHQVGLFIDDMYFCGGSLISQDYVLTAAHCCDGAFFIEVVMGAHMIRETESTQVRKTSYDFATHEDWDPNRITNDICWIKLPETVELNDNIQTVALSSGSDPAVGEMVEATGWGKDSDSAGGISPVLREVTVPVESNEDCDSYYGIVKDSHICIDSKGGRGTCNGDSGGPLTFNGVHVGLTSFGSSRGCESGAPDAFTRTSYFRDWIREKTGV